MQCSCGGKAEGSEYLKCQGCGRVYVKAKSTTISSVSKLGKFLKKKESKQAMTR